MPKRTENAETPVRVARVSAIQAIVVALITAAAGLAAGYLTKSAAPALQRWIVLDGVDGDGSLAVRVVITINGYRFSYPSNAVYAQVGPGMAKERFPIPVADRYLISFRALTERSADEQWSEEASFVESISEVPSGERKYDLYPVQARTRAANDSLSIRYHLE